MRGRGQRVFRKLYLEFVLGGITYFCMEVVFRAAVSHKPPHPLVIILGGAAFLIGIGVCRIPLKRPFNLLKPLLGGALITAWELVFGLFFNLYLGYNIWSYHGLRFELLGQICLGFSLIWVVAMLLIVILDHVVENFILKNSLYSFRALERGGQKRMENGDLAQDTK